VVFRALVILSTLFRRCSSIVIWMVFICGGQCRAESTSYPTSGGEPILTPTAAGDVRESVVPSCAWCCRLQRGYVANLLNIKPIFAKVPISKCRGQGIESRPFQQLFSACKRCVRGMASYASADHGQTPRLRPVGQLGFRLGSRSKSHPCELKVLCIEQAGSLLPRYLQSDLGRKGLAGVAAGGHTR
jgi:hypothetical protein